MFKKKLSTIIIIAILISINIPFINSATEEGYGEGNTNLGQFTDTFENDNNITVIDDLIVNATLECIELNYTSGGSKIYENFTEYTEVDIPANRIQRTDYHIDHRAYRSETTYLYYDKGVDYFTDVLHEFRARSGLEQVLANAEIWMLANDLGDVYTLLTSNKHFISLDIYRGTSYAQLVMREGYGGTNYVDTISYPVVNTWYYFRPMVDGTNFTCVVYTDSAMTIVFGTLYLNLHAVNSYRYIYGCSSVNTGGSNYLTTDIENLWIGDMLGGYEEDGYFITEDYLNYTTGNSLALLTNASIPEGTTLTVQFSNDNETWVDNEGNVGSTSIEDGFYAIDLRNLNYTDDYKMVNFTGTSSLTPRLYQLREVTTNGTAGDGVSAPSEDYAGLLIVGLIIGLIIGIGASRS